MTDRAQLSSRACLAVAHALLLVVASLAAIGGAAVQARANGPSAMDEADALVREGAALGEAGLWDAAIARFRQAEARFPRATHDCNIGLAYMRSRRPHAGLFHLERCQRRADAALPPWVEVRRREALTTMARGGFGEVELVLAPGEGTPVGPAWARVEAFGDERVALPSSVWLPVGEQTVVIEAEGRESASRVVRVDARGPTRVALELGAAVAKAPDVGVRPEIPDAPGPDPVVAPTVPETGPDLAVAAGEPRVGGSRAGAWLTLGVGLGAVAVGAVLYGVAAQTSDDASQLPPGAEFDAALGAFERERAFSYGLLGVGAAAAGVGLVWLLVADDEPNASVVPVAGGGLVRFGGRF